jgi:hypothetical protein
MAKDIIQLLGNAKGSSNTPVYLYGLAPFGPHLINRLLQINGSLFSAVILDGACAGPSCNPTTSDVQMDAMGRTLFSKCTTTDGSICQSKFGTSANIPPFVEHIRYTNAVQASVCGYTLTGMQGIDQQSMAAQMFNPHLRSLMFSNIEHFVRFFSFF